MTVAEKSCRPGTLITTDPSEACGGGNFPYSGLHTYMCIQIPWSHFVPPAPSPAQYARSAPLSLCMENTKTSYLRPAFLPITNSLRYASFCVCTANTALPCHPKTAGGMQPNQTKFCRLKDNGELNARSRFVCSLVEVELCELSLIYQLDVVSRFNHHRVRDLPRLLTQYPCKTVCLGQFVPNTTEM